MFEKQQAQCSQKPFVSWRVSSHSQFVSGSQTQTKRVRSLLSTLEERMFSAKELSAIFLKVVGPAVSSGKILTKVYLFTYFCGSVGSKLILVENENKAEVDWDGENCCRANILEALLAGNTWLKSRAQSFVLTVSKELLITDNLLFWDRQKVWFDAHFSVCPSKMFVCCVMRL